MNPSNSAIDYSQFGGTKIEPEKAKDPQADNPEKKTDYSQFGGESVKPKVGKFKSALYGAAEGATGLLGLAQYGVNEWSKGLEKAFGIESPELSFEQENPILNMTSQFPESEDQTSRRIRTGTSGVVAGSPFGIPGILAGLIGSQAGQTIREIYGEDGKFEDFGWGEGAAIGADVLAGGLTGVGASLAKGAGRGATQAARQVPAIFKDAKTGLQKAIVKNTIQGEKNALQGVINNFGESQIRGFEEQAATISPNTFTELTQSSASTLKQNADGMFRQGQLSLISPIAVTTEQGGTALQQSANAVFKNEVIGAERAAYGAARESANGVSGKAPRTLSQAKKLRSELTATAPRPDQAPMVSFLDGLIADLETTTQGFVTPASSILDASGSPVTQAINHPTTTKPTVRPANFLVTKVQDANQAVNYGSELRQQSHRLVPIVNTFRQEVGQVLAKKPEAARLFQEANQLHGTNAEVWGTKYMRNVRFAENPEKIVGQTKLASNMRNFKQGVQDPAMQSLAERMAVEDITKSGNAESNRIAVRNLSPELSPQARNASEQLVNVKDPLTTTGGRATVRNEILKDAAQAVNTGKRPKKILELMGTPKGYEIVRESLSASPQGRQMFQSFERLFVEDVFNSITDNLGRIDFKKAQSVFKNQDVRNVVERIGGANLIQRFNQLETFSQSLERNMSLYKSEATKTLFQKMVKETKSAGLFGLILHSLHVPVEVIAGLGLLKATASASKVGLKAIRDRVLANPKAVRMLESISRATTTEELAKQLPRFLKEIEVESDEE